MLFNAKKANALRQLAFSTELIIVYQIIASRFVENENNNK